MTRHLSMCRYQPNLLEANYIRNKSAPQTIEHFPRSDASEAEVPQTCYSPDLLLHISADRSDPLNKLQIINRLERILVIVITVNLRFFKKISLIYFEVSLLPWIAVVLLIRIVYSTPTVIIIKLTFIGS